MNWLDWLMLGWFVLIIICFWIIFDERKKKLKKDYDD